MSTQKGVEFVALCKNYELFCYGYERGLILEPEFFFDGILSYALYIVLYNPLSRAT